MITSILYYFKKADMVVVVEANPVLANQIRARFPDPIRDGRLTVHNRVLACEKANLEANFYIHKTFDVRSQFPRPGDDRMHQFTEIQLQSVSVLELIGNAR